MARGFESKDVEFQQDEAARKDSGRGTPAERASEAKRQGIELSLLKARADRGAATNPHHRSMLDGAIRALEDQLTAV